MSGEHREFKGVWFPAEVWLDNRLTALEKIILMEIDSLDNEENCYASNEYLARFCQCSQSKVSKSVAKLKELGYVEVVSFDGRNRRLRSCLAFFTRQTSKNDKADWQNLPQRILEEVPSKNSRKDNICAKPKKTGFKPPTREEVRAFVKEKGYHFDPDHFFEYYEASDWHLQNGKRITRWKQCCVTWERNASKDRNGGCAQRKIDLSQYSEPKVGSMRIDNMTGRQEVYKGNGVWEEYVSDYVPQEGDEDIDF